MMKAVLENHLTPVGIPAYILVLNFSPIMRRLYIAFEHV